MNFFSKKNSIVEINVDSLSNEEKNCNKISVENKIKKLKDLKEENLNEFNFKLNMKICNDVSHNKNIKLDFDFIKYTKNIEKISLNLNENFYKKRVNCLNTENFILVENPVIKTPKTTKFESYFLKYNVFVF